MNAFQELTVAFRQFGKTVGRTTKAVNKLTAVWPNPGRDVVRSQRQRRHK